VYENPELGVRNHGNGHSAAYPLAKGRFRGRKVTLIIFLVGLGIPQVITLYPLLELTHDMGLSGSVWVLLLPYIGFGLPFEILVMRGAFRQVPPGGDGGGQDGWRLGTACLGPDLYAERDSRDRRAGTVWTGSRRGTSS
jgi:hypothetical protein